MPKTLGMRWLVVAAGAAMLLVLGAACTKEVEVPGETIIVEKEVVKTVEVPGETIIKEVPGETIIKEVMVPGKTVVVTKEVIKEVEVPGETVVVTKEVIKEVEVPGKTVVVTKEVLKVVEVRPGYVTDPSNGRVYVAPQYGGSIAEAIPSDPPHSDTWWGGSGVASVILLLEKMGIVDWSIDRDKWDLTSSYTPLSVVRGQLAESYDISPDELTYTFHIRPGVHWQDKPPMNGRELVAEDIVFNFHRMMGLGDFAEAGPSPYVAAFTKLPIESIEATDKYTVVFKLTRLDFNAFEMIYQESHEGSWIYPPEVIKQYGHMQDWKTAVGTGPYMLTDWVKGSAITYTKNPNYWDYDEKFPENRLPYLDEIKMLVIPDASTRLSALRTGKINRLAPFVTGITTDQAEALQKTNPELVMTTTIMVAYGFAMNVRKAPFDDIRVRTAMQLALDLETMNDTLFGGLGDTTPYGLVGPATIGFHTPFEEWPEDVKVNYEYDPERARSVA